MKKIGISRRIKEEGVDFSIINLLKKTYSKISLGLIGYTLILEFYPQPLALI
jgi:hypothetical protein